MINTKLIMTSSAIFLGIMGLGCTFLPDEILQFVGTEPKSIYSLMIQMLGAVYFAFALLNWTAKANTIGGIYSRPITIGNMAHFVMGSLAMVKFFMGHTDMKLLLVPIAGYAIFAFCFWRVFSTSPV